MAGRYNCVLCTLLRERVCTRNGVIDFWVIFFFFSFFFFSMPVCIVLLVELHSMAGIAAQHTCF